jgi:stress response protein YsnF
MTAPAPDDHGAHLIRSEERLTAGVRRVPYSRVRLEKFVVTETRTVTVEVRREEVRLVHLDPAPDAGTDVADGSPAAGAADGPVDRWLTLSEERVAITTEVVPVERVRLQVDTVTVEREVTEPVRREEVVVETMDTTPTGDELSAGTTGGGRV